jgi:hypothetical protein
VALRVGVGVIRVQVSGAASSCARRTRYFRPAKSAL